MKRFLRGFHYSVFLAKSLAQFSFLSSFAFCSLAHHQYPVSRLAALFSFVHLRCFSNIFVEGVVDD